MVPSIFCFDKKQIIEGTFCMPANRSYFLVIILFPDHGKVKAIIFSISKFASEENKNAADRNLQHLMACRCNFIFLLLEDRLIRF